jgi:glucose-6-phosphate isomerase
LRERTGLPIDVDFDACRLILGEGLNQPSYRVRSVHDHEPVWAGKVDDEDHVLYFYSSGLWLDEDVAAWKDSGIIYGIVVFLPGVYGGEYVKSAGQYHPICGKNTQATPEIYTVLHGTGHFLLQKAAPDYDEIEDAVLVEVDAGETFIVPPDYGHLQINPTPQPLVFSYTVMDGMQGVYAPFRQRRGAIYYEMAEGPNQYVFNPRYPQRIPLRFARASQLCQFPPLADSASYRDILRHLPDLKFLTDPALFPPTAHFPQNGELSTAEVGLRYDLAGSTFGTHFRERKEAPQREAARRQ